VIQRLLPFLSLIILFVALSLASPHFLTQTNLSSVVRQTAVINIMALGMTMIIIAGGIDLSVGAILAMGGLMGTMAMEKGASIPLGVLLGVLTGLACGLVNGVLTTRLRIAPFIVTLGTLGIFRGVTLIISNGLPVHKIPASFSFLGEGNILGVPFVLWLLVACAVLTHLALEHTRLGRYAFAIGSNAKLEVPPFGRPAVPPRAAIRMTTTPAAVQEGQALYSHFCLYCHGVMAVAGGGVPDLRYATAQTHQQFEAIVLGGVRESRGMPSFKDVLKRDQVRAIQAYVLSRAAASANPPVD